MSSMPLAYAHCSLPGARSYNEDALRVARIGEQFHLVLADGAGGHARGAEAAKQVVDAIDAELAGLAARATPPEPTLLQAIVERAHDALRAAQPAARLAASADAPPGAAARHARPSDSMHATVVVLWLDLARRLAAWAHVGDSRLYLLQHHRVVQVSHDDSAVQLLVDAGVIDREQASRHPAKNRLLAALGIADDVDPHAAGGELRDGDVWLACTDGWWDGLTDSDLEHSLDGSLSVSAWVEQMRVHLAFNPPPNQDNHSAVAVWVGRPEDITRAMPAFVATVPDETVSLPPLDPTDPRYLW
jgi:serine/threonine protein phosphatase PrpC